MMCSECGLEGQHKMSCDKRYTSLKLFTAEWCVNCKPIKKLIEENKYTVDIINVDEHPDFVRASGVRSVPSLLLGDGTVVVGSAEIRRVIEESYGSASHTN